MFKKNIIAIAIVTLGLVMASNAFGQERPKRPNKNDKPKKADSIIKPMYVANQEEYMAGGIADVRGGPHDRGEETARTKNNNGFVSPSSDPRGIKVPQPKGMNKADLTEQLSVKSPRDVATGQSANIVEVYEGKGSLAVTQKTKAAAKSKNLGDTGTHEVGHKQRKARKN